MADGTVNIDVILDASQAKGSADDINKMFDDIGDKASSTYKGIVDQYGRPLKMDADTEGAENKVKRLGETYASIPKDLRTKLVADAEDHGIKNMDELLRKMPKELRTELIAKAQKGEVIDYEGLLKRLPAKMLTDVQLNDQASPSLRRLQAEANRTGEQFTSLKDIIRGSFVGNLLASGAQTIMGYLSGIAHEAITTSDAMDKFKMTMKLGGFGSAEIARSSREVKKYADDTVYDLGDITSTSSQLASNGIKGYEKLTEAAGNLNAQAGGTKDTFKSVALVLTQTAGAGKLTTENWNQMANAMPGASGVLQKEMKKNGAYTGNFRDAMAQGQITADEFFDAIEKLGTTKGAEEAAKSTNTFEGAVGNLEAQIITSMDAVIDKLGKKRITNMINGATSAVAALTTGLMNVFAFISEHTTIAKTLLSLMVAIFATKRISEFIGALGQAKTALAEFGLQEAATNAIGSGGGGAGGAASAGGAAAVGGMSRALSFAGKAVPVAAAAYGVSSEVFSNRSTGQKIGGSLGSIGGAVGGQALGGAIGTLIAPGIGTAVGQMLGGSVGTWVGKKFGDKIGKSAQKQLSGRTLVANTKIKVNSETAGVSRAVRPDLNRVTRMVVKMDVDNNSINATRAKTNKLYDDMEKRLTSYYKDKEAKSKKDLDILVKNGQMTQKQEDKQLAKQKKRDQERITQNKKSLERMRKDTNDHYTRLQQIQNGSSRKMQAAAQKYGTDSKKYQQIRHKELEKENERFGKKLVKDQTENDKAIQASVKKGASAQEKIYRDLRRKRGKLSEADLKQTQRDANKQYQAAVRPAKKAHDEIVKAADDRYRKTKKAAEKEYKENHTISRKQYKEIVANANNQHDETVAAADDEYKKNTRSARKQHKEVTREINRQKDDVITAANGQASGHSDATDNEMYSVNQMYAHGFGGAGKIWNGFLDGVKSVLNFFKASTKGMGSVPERYYFAQKYATGTGSLPQSQLALVGEEGFELGYNPQRGYHVLGSDGPELRYLPQGESILTHGQSKNLLSMFGSKVPGYAEGTGAKIGDFIKNGVEDAFDLIGKGASEIWNWLKEKTGLDRMLNRQESGGGIKRTTHGSFDYAKNAIGNYIKKMADKFMETIGGFGGKMSKDQFTEAAKVAAALMHQSLSDSDISRLYWQAMVESTVNPAQGGGIDDHDGTGRPIGLFQFKLGTWGAAVRHLPSGHSNIHSAVDQIMAVLADSTWRSDLAPIGVRRGWSPHGYANGGWADMPGIFGEVPGEPELVVNPARHSAEGHIAEAIEARAKVNPNGFAGGLSKLISMAQHSKDGLVPTISDAHGTHQAIATGNGRGTDLSGDMTIAVNLDSATIAQVTYPKMKAMRTHELIIHGAGGAVPVGRAMPTGGGF